MKRFMQTMALVLGCLVVMIPVGVSAAGYENIGGGGSGVYYTERTITYPPSAGPEVAFIQYSSGYLRLGAHSCGGTYYGLNTMAPGAWRAVYTTSVPQTFCLYASSANNAAWNGDLAWD